MYENPYFLLTPGPLSTSKTVKEAMLRDWCTWDNDYNSLVENLRNSLVELATESDQYTSVLMQGSGTFSVEAVIGSMIPKDGKLLIVANGAYGNRMGKISEYLGINYTLYDFGEREQVSPEKVEQLLSVDSEITHVAVVHCETTTGMLNPIKEIGDIVKRRGKIYFVDAMSSFGGIEFDVADIGADFMVSSANKCIQGVPGFGFIIARKDRLIECEGRARSLSLDIYDQWETMEKQGGKWRFTSPTHVVRAFIQALDELKNEGGVKARERRYSANQTTLVEGMERLGFRTLLESKLQSPIITSFYNPESERYDFMSFYQSLKERGFVIYPGKISGADTFRIGNIGEVYPEDIEALIKSVEESIFW